MRALALEHLHSNPLGVYGDVLVDRGIDVDRVLLDRGDQLPDWRAYELLVVMGGGMSAYDDDEYPWLASEKRAIREAVSAGVPYFGVCLGSQLLASALGGRVYLGPEPELGVIPVFLCEAARRDPVFRGLPPDLEVFQWHCDTFTLPDGATRLARSPRYENQAFRYGEVAYAIQCHLETTLEEVQDWFAAWPSLGETFEGRYGQGSLDAFLDEYAASIPQLRATARQLFRRWLESALAHGKRPTRLRNEPVADGGRLLGRDNDLARLRALIAGARAGRGGALTLIGPAGAGKSALLEAAERDAEDIRVLRTVGIERVAEQPMAGLAALCRPVRDLLPELPDAQATPLALALGDHDHGRPPDDRFAVYTGAASLLAAAARSQPLLVLVDDAHLLDEPSREAIEFIASRLADCSIAMIVATEGPPGEGADVLELHPLDRTAALTLLDRRYGTRLAAAVAADVIDAAAGNPLALLEIPESLTSAQLSGAEPAASALAVCRSAEQAFLARISALPAETRQALVVVALGSGEPPAVVGRALAELGWDEQTLEPAVAANLVTRSDKSIVFRHELARATVAYGALRSERRAAHRALGQASERPETRAWHRALALAAPNEETAAELADVGGAAAGRSAFATAGRAFELAARITPDDVQRADRLVAAADASHRAGHTAAAIDHLEEALGHLPSSESRGAAELLLGRVLARSGSAARARDILLHAADAGSTYTPATACLLLTEAVIPTLRAGDPAAAVATGRRALALATPASLEELSAAIALGTALVLGGDLAAARDLVHHARELASNAALRPTPASRVYLGNALRLVGEREAARHELEGVIELARTSGSVSVLAYALVRLADVELDDGNWQAAATQLSEAVTLARETGQAADRGLAAAGLAWLAATQGREDDCRRFAAQALELAERLGAGSRLDRSLSALGLLELGRGDHAAAATHLTEVRREQRAHGWCDAAVQPHRAPDLVEALIGAGEVAAAADELAGFEAEASRTGRSSAIAAAARGRGILASDRELDHWFQVALEPGTDVIGRFELARTHLAYAERLALAGREDDAGPHASAAGSAFGELGAEPWRLRAERALG